jgi:hypothetical protein
LQGISPGGTTVFSQSLNWDLTADVTGGPWKGTKIKRRPQKDVSVFQGHRRKRHLLQGLPGNFPIKITTRVLQLGLKHKLTEFNMQRKLK